MTRNRNRATPLSWIRGCLAALAAGLAAVTIPGGLKAQGTLTLITTEPGSYTVSLVGMSADGAKVFFSSNNPITAADIDNGIDVYEASGGTLRLLTGGSTITPANFKCASPDGTKVIFETFEQLAGDGDFSGDLYVAANGTITLLTGSGAGNSPAASFRGASADCSKVFFETPELLDPNDLDGSNDVYQVDVSTGAITLLSGGTTNVPAFFAGASADGSTVFFRTLEALAGDGDTFQDIYEASSGAIALVTPGTSQSAGYAGSSASGDAVFITTAESLSAADTDAAIDVYRCSTYGCSLLSGGGPAGTAATFLGASTDGSIVFFETTEAIVAADVDTASDVYQNAGGTISLVTGGTNDALLFRFASSDGSRVIFITQERLDAADVDTAADVYQAAGGVITLLSPGTINTHAFFKGASTDGSVVFFETTEPLVGSDTNTAVDLYASVGGAIVAVSHGAGGTWLGAMADGTKAFFLTAAQLVPEDTDAYGDVYRTPVAAAVTATPTVTTLLSQTSIALGMSVTDTVTVTGDTAGGAPTGSVTVTLYSDSTCTTAVANSVTAALVPGGGNLSTASGIGPFTPAAVGTFYVRAHYNSGTPDPDYTDADSNCTDGALVVSQGTSTVTTTLHDDVHNVVPDGFATVIGAELHGLATVTPSSAAAPTGFAEFRWYSSLAACTADSNFTGGTVAGNTGLDGANPGVAHPSIDFNFSVASYAVRSRWSGDSNYTGGMSSCVTFSVTPRTPDVVTMIHNAAEATITSARIGNPVHPSVTVFGLVGAPIPAGTVTVRWFTNGSCKGMAIAGQGSLTGGTVDLTSFAQTPTKAGSYSFQATYNGSADYNVATSPCQPLTVSAQLVPTFTTRIHDAAHNSWNAVPVGTPVHDSVIVNANGGPTPTGTVTIDWFARGTCKGKAAASSPALALVNGAIDAVSFVQTPAVAGSYSFSVSYSGDSTFAAATAPCQGLTVP